MCGWVVALLGRGEARWTRSWPEGTFRWPLGQPKPETDRRRPFARMQVGALTEYFRSSSEGFRPPEPAGGGRRKRPSASRR